MLTILTVVLEFEISRTASMVFDVWEWFSEMTQSKKLLTVKYALWIILWVDKKI